MTDEKWKEIYRDFFGIHEKYLIDCSIVRETKEGNIVFIDEDNRLQYINRQLTHDDRDDEAVRQIAKLKLAEAVPTKHLPDHIQVEFKKHLGVGYVHALNYHFEDIPKIISDAQEYLRQRNQEYSRKILLRSGIPAVVLAFIVGFVLYMWGNRNPWMYGLVFSVFGAFSSIWMRYGKIQNTGYGEESLHILECNTRIIVGVIFSIIAMIAIRCRLVLPHLEESDELFAFTIGAFIAAFSERLVPSILERMIERHE